MQIYRPIAEEFGWNVRVPRGKLTRPVPGFLPKGGCARLPAAPNAFSDHIEIIRDHPARWDDDREQFVGGWYLIAEYKTGGRTAQVGAAKRDADMLGRWLKRNVPLELWEIRTRYIPDTWFHRQLWVRFLGVLTPEQYAREKANHRAQMMAPNGLFDRDYWAETARIRAAWLAEAEYVKRTGSARVR
jgi:hypothetical protein